MMTNTAKRKTVTTTVLSPIPITDIRIGTSAEIGALTKMLIHKLRTLPRFSNRAIRMPTGRPITIASAIPRAKERNEMDAAAANFAVGRIVIAATNTRETGGIMIEYSARPTSSHRRNQTNSEKKRGILLPKKVMVAVVSEAED